MPCKACPRSAKVSIWQSLGCQRGGLEVEARLCTQERILRVFPESPTTNLLEAISLSLQATRCRRPLVRQGFHLNFRCLRVFRFPETSDFPGSFEHTSSLQSVRNVTVSDEVGGPFARQEEEYFDELQEFELSPSPSIRLDEASMSVLGCRNCFSILDSVKTWRCTYHRHSFRGSVATTLWEILDNPSTLETLKIDNLAHFTKLLEAASRYGIEVADVSLI